MQKRQDKLAESLALLMTTLARGTPPASTPEQPQESRGGVDAGAAEGAKSTPEKPQESHRGVGAGAAEGANGAASMPAFGAYLALAAGEPPATPPTPSTPRPVSRRDVDAGDDEDTIEAGNMNAYIDVLTPSPTALRSLAFEGNSQAVAAQVRLILNSFGLGALTVPHVPPITATQNAIYRQRLREHQSDIRCEGSLSDTGYSRAGCTDNFPHCGSPSSHGIEPARWQWLRVGSLAWMCRQLPPSGGCPSSDGSE